MYVRDDHVTFMRMSTADFGARAKARSIHATSGRPRKQTHRVHKMHVYKNIANRNSEIIHTSITVSQYIFYSRLYHTSIQGR